ncbi:MAG TPA: 4-alpha-glucanotransferase [Polyangiaceae bacterium]|jgi:4-alpha-glucanotransferase
MPSPRTAGVTIPLSSIRTRRDWGIGQIGDLPACAAWIKRAGHRLLQLLPPYELAAGETSPYGARTAFGLDPIYITVEDVPDLDAAGLDAALGEEGRQERDRLRAAPRTDYARVRALKTRVLHQAFERFHAREWKNGTARAGELKAWIERERDWAEDLGIYVALRESHGNWAWDKWPGEERHRVPSTIVRMREALATPILEHHYLQWIALTQWMKAREQIARLGVELMGDLPFIVCAESADVWSRSWQFRRDVSLGAPPDGFSPEGQDWGLPAFDRRAMEEDDLKWLRARTRHAARLYDRFRLDHVVGYFRQYVKRPGERGFFDPAEEPAQRAHGERVLRTMQEEATKGNGHAAQVIAEDLGVIPPFVRQTLRDLGIPGYRVIPWEKDDGPSGPSDATFRDPSRFPAVSLATWSTHDTAPITSWWDEFSRREQDQLTQLAHVPQGASEDERVLSLLGMLFRSGSALTLVLVQELLGERTRINTPGTVGDANWTYRLPRPLEDLETDGAVNARLDKIRTLVVESGRG